VERSLGRDSGVASLHHYDGQTAGRSQRAAHPAEVARRLRQWRRRCGRGGCADRYHHYFQLLDSHTNTNAHSANPNPNGNSEHTNSNPNGHSEHANSNSNGHSEHTDADADADNANTDANSNSNTNTNTNSDTNINTNADTERESHGKPIPNRIALSDTVSDSGDQPIDPDASSGR
jgi:hypothetical protein